MSQNQTQRAAAAFAATLKEFTYGAVPRIESAVIADVQNYVTYGYVLASSGRGSVQVYGVPAATAVRGTRIYIQNVGPERNQRYIYQTTANACVNSTISGSIGMVNPTPINTTWNHTGTNQGINNYPLMPSTLLPSVPGGASAGAFFSFFFNIPSTPASEVCLMELQGQYNSLINGYFDVLRITYDSNGILWLKGIYDYRTVGQVINAYYRTTQIVSTNIWHYVVFQLPGISNWQALYLDGYSTQGNGQSLWSQSGNPTFTTGPYFLTLFNAFTRSMACPAGTLLSKIALGYSTAGPPILGVPTNDSQIPNGRGNNGLTTNLLYLTQYGTDITAAGTPGTTGAAMPDLGSSGENLTLDTYYITGFATGPYKS